MLEMGVHTHLITCRAAIPLMLRTAAAGGTRGLVIEMTDGTSQANAEFRRNVGFYYDLVRAHADRWAGTIVSARNSPTPTVSPTLTAAGQTAGATWPTTAGSVTTAQGSRSSADRRGGRQHVACAVIW
jgi:hypothetical protein